MRHWSLAIAAAALVLAGCSSPSSEAGDDDPSPSASPTASPSESPSASASLAPTTGPPSPPASPTSRPPGGNRTFSTVTVARTGGIAALRDQYTVTPSGALTGQTQGGATVRKQLSPTALAQLRSLATGSQFAGEARRGPIRPPSCADGFNYTVSSGSVRVSGTDCGSLAQESPAMWRIAQLVIGAANAA